MVKLTSVTVDGYRKSTYTVDTDGLREALRSDHPCSVCSCDVGAATEQGYLYTAAHLLMGATECEATGVVMRALAFNGENVGTHPYDAPDWSAWEAFHTAEGRECFACDAWNYPTERGEPTACGNCLEELPMRLDVDGQGSVTVGRVGGNLERQTWRVVVRNEDGETLSDSTDLRTTHGDADKAMGDALSFLEHVAERYVSTGMGERYDETDECFNLAAAEWAYGVSDELAMLRLDLEEDDDEDDQGDEVDHLDFDGGYPLDASPFPSESAAAQAFIDGVGIPCQTCGSRITRVDGIGWAHFNAYGPAGGPRVDHQALPNVSDA